MTEWSDEVHEVYQYKLIMISPISINPTALEHQLNELGLEGWYVLNSQPDYLLLERVQEVIEVMPNSGEANGEV